MPQHTHRGRKDGKPARQEFGLANVTKGSARQPQRKVLERQVAASGDPDPGAAREGDDTWPQADGSPPRLDRAG